MTSNLHEIAAQAEEMVDLHPDSYLALPWHFLDEPDSRLVPHMGA